VKENELVSRLRGEVRTLRDYPTPVRASEHVNVGRQLRADLERVGRALGYDATGLARVVLHEFVDAQDARRAGP
jgi:hypothetical protein